ncbi:response regulator [Candidatus Fermentibacteria bacterium]|nr:response regulator [Candidatus Fermentibacteria bacterium]
MTDKTGKPIDILLVEDNAADARLAKEALKDSKIRNELYHVEDGESAIDFLYRKGEHEKAPRPDLILLDLNLPRKDGREVLAEIKGDEDLRRIPVVILTISKDEADVLKTYDLHANCYITKPINLDRFLEVIKSIEDFWLSIVKLPPNGVL